MTGVERVNVGKRGIGAEQIAQRAPLKPVPMQSPLAARRQQPIRYQHKQHLIETRALTRSWQSLAPERIESELLPELQAEPARTPLPRPLEPQLRELQAHDRSVRHHRLATILGKQRERSRRLRRLVQHFDRAAPRELLRGVDLPQIQHVPLQHAPAAHALVLHHAEVAVLFAILLASGRAQKHPGTRLSAELRRAPEARSSLQPFLRDSSHSRSHKTTGYTARQSRKQSESAKSG